MYTLIIEVNTNLKKDRRKDTIFLFLNIDIILLNYEID